MQQSVLRAASCVRPPAAVKMLFVTGNAEIGSLAAYMTHLGDGALVL